MMSDGSGAIEAVIERFARLLRGTGRRRGLSDAELDEVTQELRLRLWKHFGDSERIAAVPASYVQKAVRSAIIDRIRRRREHRDGGSLDGLSPAREPVARHDAVALVHERALTTEVERALELLADSRRGVVRMWLAGYPNEEIAQLMGWTDAKVRNLLSRGLADLRDVLRQRGVGVER
jgi:RNA polymerase sigma-70 factor (ECF subfamily)